MICFFEKTSKPYDEVWLPRVSLSLLLQEFRHAPFPQSWANPFGKAGHRVVLLNWEKASPEKGRYVLKVVHIYGGRSQD